MTRSLTIPYRALSNLPNKALSRFPTLGLLNESLYLSVITSLVTFLISNNIPGKLGPDYYFRD
jgi:hypothetical protein